MSVTWTEFQAGPQLLESLNVGATDFGLVGEAPSIFAQAAGANIVYAGFEPASPKNEAIIVPKDSPIRAVTDLKGKRVALNKGSNVNYLIVKALEANGLTYSDIVPAYLAPADAEYEPRCQHLKIATIDHGEVPYEIFIGGSRLTSSAVPRP